MIVRALVLAAGKGERLRPLTLRIPKPLLPVRGEAVTGRTLRALKRAGVEAAALNLHHLGGAIRAHFGKNYAGLPITYSEEPELLGTSGALPPLAEFFASADLVLIVNGDSLCDWPFEALIRTHVEARVQGALATVLLTSYPDPRGFGGGVGVDRTGAKGRALVFRGVDSIVPGVPKIAARRVFAGAQVLEPSLLRRIPEGPGDIVTVLYEPLLREGARIQTYTTRRKWFDLGTPERLREAGVFVE
jgi:mannose-1-phosphate guanylyltransferase